MNVPNLTRLFDALHKSLLDALFPRRCLDCRTYDTWLCNDCHNALPIITEQHCPFCTNAITPLGQTCLACIQKYTPALSGVFVASSYKDPLLKKAIHHFKYRFIKELADPLALLIAQSLSQSHLPTPDIIIAVPLHHRRLRWRGFNQSQLLCDALDLKITHMHDALIRSRYTPPQTTTPNKKYRQQNLRNAFTAHNPQRLVGKNILLIDDVTTTSSTLEECARTLKKAGARSVYGLVIARDL